MRLELPAELKTVHTKKFHLLIIDETLTDFHHVHPDLRGVAGHPGEYPFTWTPNRNAFYRAWADITLYSASRQGDGEEYAPADMPSGRATGNGASLSEQRSIALKAYRFNLSFPEPLLAGQGAMIHLHVARADGQALCAPEAPQPCRILSPVLGAFAHMVGFNEDFHSVLHAHPLGPEPLSAADRGAPDIDFHIVPPKAGAYRIFVQLIIKGETYLVPFAVHAEFPDSRERHP